MRILMVNGTYGGVSGSGRAVELLSKELLGRGFRVSLFTNQTVGYINIPKLKSISFATLAKLKEKTKCDIVHVHNPKFSIVAKKAFPNVLTIHGDYIIEFSLLYSRLVSNLFDRWFRTQVKKFRATTCVSPYWSKIRGLKYIPNGLNLKEVQEIQPSNEKYVLYVGRKNIIKGYDIFEEAVKKTSYPYKMLGVQEKVPWTQVISYMKSAYCLVLPSKQEGMPFVILEAFASGCPVIATDLPTLRSFGEGTIYFLKKRDAGNIKYAIDELVENQLLWKNLRRKGFQKAKEYDIRKVADQYISIYERLMADP